MRTITITSDGFNHHLTDDLGLDKTFMGSKLKPRHMKNWYKQYFDIRRVHMRVI